MLLRALRAEQMKLRRSPVWLAFLLLPLIPAIMGTINFSQNTGLLRSQWHSLWTQQTLFTCYFFMPALIAVYCAYLFRLEHLHHNWNSVLTTPMPVAYLWLSKLMLAGGMLLVTQLLIGVLFFLSGRLFCQFTEPFPLQTVCLWLLRGFLGGLVICAMQLLLSLWIRSFAVPVGLALMGGVAVIAALAQGIGAAYPYAPYALGMCANRPTREMLCSVPSFVGGSIFYLLLCTVAALLYLKRTDVRA